MKVVILAGGSGTRAYPYTDYLPKPMMPVGGKPILLRVMDLYARQGFTEFVLSVGYRKEVILDYFEGRDFGWTIDIVDTGAGTDTGGRIWGCRHLLGETFMATYADGLSDVVLDSLLAAHRRSGKLATITSVPLRSQYGTIEADEAGTISDFREKPVLRDHWINAGFFVMQKRIFDKWQGENLEREVFPNLLHGKHLAVYRHDGFFKSLDTYKDQQELEVMFADGNLPWIRRAVAA
ncbi:sugar phosphate nucleotidyltransferase [Falsiroseomonas sp.]|uniref:sugar phosphate nucleotidyltransferase n=1 Tax=Falsiroseomonas sp. TaxID=2870721 RepID=UPI00271A96E6|nr:sugar phosphate nucleotidyltransferase [Falsiroseomonas sp.]MDO9499294.1 sugar phosphate nucleotidyltransferase [Falsiroseomonas sp.]MDP3415513.1 sugar phosphate nucleotidyltransferase [Falsiroseomonas sp.]